MRAAVDERGPSAALVAATLDPTSLMRLDSGGWERTLSCARRNSVLAYLAERAAAAGILDELPEPHRDALLSARISASRLAQLARWELDRVYRVLKAADIPMIALKGVAYLLRAMPHARTRRLSDIDIMVPRNRISEAEEALVTAGWGTTVHDRYDELYYRRWSHEIPPLLYPGRLLAVDVHHTLCPPVSRLRPDPATFWANAEATGDDGLYLLSPVDTALHTAVHLFFDSDFDGRFRDLIDMHELFKTFGADDAFWDALVARAGAQGLGRPLYYASEALTRVLGTPIPARIRNDVLTFQPAFPVAKWMNNTLAEVLSPVDPQHWPPANRGRLWLLYVRSHWLRMPAYLLVPHLVRKSIRRQRQ